MKILWQTLVHGFRTGLILILAVTWIFSARRRNPNKNTLFIGALLLGIGIAAAMLFSSYSTQAAGTTRYVDKGNTCPGDGSSGNPYCSIQNAVNAAVAGDDIRIRKSGTPYDEQVTTQSSGTAGSPITIESDNAGNQPTLRYTGSGATAAMLRINHAFWTVQNLTFDGTGIFTSEFVIWVSGDVSGTQILNNLFKNWGGTEAQTDTGCSGSPCGIPEVIDDTGVNTVIDKNIFDGNRGLAINLQGDAATNGTVISNNEIKNQLCARQSDSALATVGIKEITWNGSQFAMNTVIKHNTFHDFQPYAGSGACGLAPGGGYTEISGFWTDIGPINGTVDGNLVYNLNQANPGFTSPGIGFHIEDNTQGWTVKNNVVHDTAQVGIYHNPNSGGAHTITDTNKYYNNTIYNVGGYGIVIYSGHAVVENNVVSNAALAQIDVEATAVSQGGVTTDYDDYWDTSGGNKVGLWNSVGPVKNFADWKSACSCDSHSKNADPLFVSTSPVDLHLKSGSPAIDAGTDLTSSGVTADFDGVARPQRIAFDMGAYELLNASGLEASFRSDILSNSQPSATSNHTFRFTVNGAVSGSSTLTLTLPSFSVPITLNCGDVDAATSSPFNFNYPACAATATAWGFSVNGAVLTLQAPTDSTSTVHVATGTQVAIYIGSNATTTQQGVHWITNPPTAGAYTVTLSGTSGNYGNFMVAIIGGQTVAAQVAESLAFTVSSVPTIGLVQKNAGAPSSCAGGQVALAYAFNNSAGNLLVAAVSLDTNGGAFSISDSQVNSWAKAATIDNGSFDVDIWYAANAKAGANTVTITNTQQNFGNIRAHIFEYSGAAISSPLDQTGTHSDAGNIVVSATTTGVTAQANELVFADSELSGGGTWTAGTGYTLEENPTLCSSVQMASEDKTATTTGKQTATFTLSAPSQYVAAVATFKGTSPTGCAADDSATVNQIPTTSTAVPFGTVSANTFYQGCQDLIVSTNAANGYSLTGQESSPLLAGSGKTIPDTTCDAGTCTESAAAAWATASNNGFGHTCANQGGVHDCVSGYSSGVNFKQFANIAGGETPQTVMSSSTPSSATGRVKYRLSAGKGQPAGVYSNIVDYILIGTY